jgi:EREBP-like factor
MCGGAVLRGYIPRRGRSGQRGTAGQQLWQEIKKPKSTGAEEKKRAREDEEFEAAFAEFEVESGESEVESEDEAKSLAAPKSVVARGNHYSLEVSFFFVGVGGRLMRFLSLWPEYSYNCLS